MPADHYARRVHPGIRIYDDHERGDGIYTRSGVSSWNIYDGVAVFDSGHVSHRSGAGADPVGVFSEPDDLCDNRLSRYFILWKNAEIGNAAVSGGSGSDHAVGWLDGFLSAAETFC